MKMIIRNGCVFDPLNRIDGEIMDLVISNGKIVEDLDSGSSGVSVVDAKNCMVMPGGVDIHSHIAGSKVNCGRLLRPEDHLRDYERYTKHTRSGVGHSIPSTFTTGYRYSRLGYTTVFEPAVPPLKARHTHEELADTPQIDTACFPLLGNNWIVMEHIAEGDIEGCAAFVAWIMKATKGYAIKIVNPGGLEAWAWGKNITGLDDEVPNFGVTPREILRGLCKVAKLLGLPHPIHVHPNNLGLPGNYLTCLRTMDCVSDLTDGTNPNLHMTHVQFISYGGFDWASINSKADKIAKYVNAHPHLTIDMGQVIFTDTTTMTADGPFQYRLHKLTGNKWVNADVESECGSGVVPIRYTAKNYVHAVMWAIGLELALFVKDPWRVFFTTDHPNGGPFTAYPRVISWLISNLARSRTLKRIPRLARARTNLSSIDREYSLYEIAIITRAGTAKSLGLSHKGHLGPGADADISIYDFNPAETDLSKEYVRVMKSFRRAKYTIKNGEILVKDGEVVRSNFGKTYWVDPQVSEDLMKSKNEELAVKFKEYYTIQKENYEISEEYLPRPCAIKTKASV